MPLVITHRTPVRARAGTATQLRALLASRWYLSELL